MASHQRNGRTNIKSIAIRHHTLSYKASAKLAIHPADGTVIQYLPTTRLVEYKHIANKKGSSVKCVDT